MASQRSRRTWESQTSLASLEARIAWAAWNVEAEMATVSSTEEAD